MSLGNFVHANIKRPAYCDFMRRPLISLAFRQGRILTHDKCSGRDTDEFHANAVGVALQLLRPC